MKDLNFCTAIVTSLDDPKEKGRIQVRLFPYMIDVKEQDLPWYEPFIGAGSDQMYEFNPPKVGSIIFVFPDETFKSGYYLGGNHIQGFYDYASIKSKLDTLDEIGNTVYPDVRFNLLEDGSLFFHTVDGDIGVVQNSGAYFLMAQNGEIYLTSQDGTKLEITNGIINLNGSTDNLVGWTALNTAIQTFIQSMALHTHMDPISGSTGPMTASVPLNIDSAKSTKNKLGM